MSSIPCDYENCPVTFSCKAGLQRHIRNVHEMKMDTPCPYCPKMCRDKFNLGIHLRRHNRESSESFPQMQQNPELEKNPAYDMCCDMCGLYIGKKDFPMHMKWHAEELRREIGGLSESLSGFFKCFTAAEATFKDTTGSQ